MSAREVAIVTRPSLRVFRNPVSMRLLQRKAVDMGISLTLISEDEMTRQLCAATGLGNYANVEAFKRDSGRQGHKHERLGSLPAPQRLAGWFSAAAGLFLLALVAAVGYFVLPAASIVLTPAVKTLEVDVPVSVDQQLSSPDLAGARIPGQVVTAEVDGQTNVRATGQREVPSQAARGFVTLTNRGGSPLTVPAGTTLLAGKIAFTTTQDVQLNPSLTIGDTQIPGESIAMVQAVEPGKAGNVAVGAITAIDGPLASQVTVINHTMMSGGAQKSVSYLSSNDEAKAKAALRAELVQQALAQIHGQVASNQTFIPDANSQSDAAIEQLTYAESPEQVTGETQMNMRVLVRGVTFQGGDVNQVVAQSVQAVVDRQGNGARLLAGAPLTLAPPQVLGIDAEVIKLRVHASAQVVSAVDSGSAAGRVRGLNPAAAQAALRKMPGVAAADVQLWPAWATRAPSLAWRIHVASGQAAE